MIDHRKHNSISGKLLLLLFLLLAVITGIYMIRTVNTEIPENLASVRLNIETYYAGKNQPTHPSVLYFENGWNGYRYWMAYSPYPYANGEEENPCIAVSNDLLNWTVPEGLHNPVAFNEETGCDELKDPHIVYRDDLDRIEVWYLGRVDGTMQDPESPLCIMRKYSYDGQHWSSCEIMSTTKYLSPSVIWDGDTYQIWEIGYAAQSTAGTLVYKESKDGHTWSATEDCCIPQLDDQTIWHGTVTLIDGIYHMVFIDTDKQSVFHCVSDDGITFSKPEPIICNAGFWDSLYRPALLYDGEQYACFYGVINSENQWYISASFGEDIHTLKGLTAKDVKSVHSLSDDIINVHSISYCIRQLYKGVVQCLRLELLAFLPILIAVIMILRKKKGTSALCFPVWLFLCGLYLITRFKPDTLLAICTVGWAWLLSAVSIYCTAYYFVIVLRKQDLT